ncbi:MAG: hypothetical protein EP332_04570 [Bacteroidetes bacterium]|nr:MAG: hypothetical protein EP332_04570 [Bacteroidota bacterium]
MKEDSPPIHLLEELQKEDTYQKLFLNRRMGLSIALLFQQFGSGTFQESDIHDALVKMTANSKNMWNQYGKAINLLQEFFIVYDQDSQRYSLTPYAQEYCKMASKQLRGRVDATRIEAICRALLEKLSDDMGESNLEEWFEVHLDAFKSELSDQVHFLDGQIKNSVDYLRQSSLINADNALLVLRGVNEGLTKVREQNKELRSAYRQLDTIREMLDTIAQHISRPELQDKIGDVNEFFGRIRFVLRAIDQKLDRIQPKIRQLFANLNQPLLNARVEQFLRILLKVSTVENKELQLPPSVHQPKIRTQPVNFTVVERKTNWFPAKRKRVILPQIKPEAAERVRQEHFQSIANQSKVDQQVALLRNKLRLNGSIVFEDEFFNLYDGQGNDLGSTVMVFYTLLQESNNDPKRKLEISPTLIKHPQGKEISLCHLTIRSL